MAKLVMTSDQKRLVRDSWKQVVPIGDTAAGLFYQRLFEIDPTARELFAASDMAEQRKKLLQMLAVVVGALDAVDALTARVEDLGRRHTRYGVRDEHYESVGFALLWTLEQGLGRAWTPDTASAWTALFEFLSGIMRRAAREEIARAHVPA